MPELGPPLGKGDAMWRALSVARGELIAYLDSDTRRFSAHFATGMLGPLLLDPDARFVKGTFRRPFAAARRARAARGRRPGHGADGAAAAVGLLSRAGRLRAAAGGRGGGAARALPPASVRHRLRGRDRDAAGRPRPARRHRAAWRRWTSTCAATATSRWPSWGRWPTRCCGWCSTGCGGTGGCSTPRTRSVARPPFASLRIAA